MIDTHAHLTSDELFMQIDDLIVRAKKADINKIFNIATDLKTLERGILLREKYPMIENIASTTPHDVDQEGESFFPVVKEMAQQKRLIAIGETGLDYHYTHSSKENQMKYFRKYIELAIEVNLPLVIHCREAFRDLIEILDQYPKMRRILIHCFTGSKEEAQECLSRGYYLSFSGILTYKKSVELQHVCATAPIEQIVIETDAPYLAPQSLRGKQNEPSYIIETLAKMAELKSKTFHEMALITSNNTKSLFKI